MLTSATLIYKLSTLKHTIFTKQVEGGLKYLDKNPKATAAEIDAMQADIAKAQTELDKLIDEHNL